MNLKKIVGTSCVLKDFEENSSGIVLNPSRSSLDSNVREILKGFEIHPHDVTVSPLIEVYQSPGSTVPNLYLNEQIAQSRTNGTEGRSRLLRLPPIKAIAEFALLGASIRFRLYDIFVEFDGPTGDYVLCLVAPKGEDNDFTKSEAPGGVAHFIQTGSWRA
jgi:hypothetical protein